MTFQYKDFATNNAVQAPTRTVIFAGSTTLTPTLSSPIGFIPITFGLDYYLPENAAPGTLKLVITYSGTVVNVNDPVTTRTIVLATASELAGGHVFSMTSLSTAVASLSSKIASITPDNDLVDGALYDFTLQYQDNGGNSVAQTIQANVGFGGANTLTPTYIKPAAGSYLGEPWEYDFILPESAAAGTVKMTFTPDNSGANGGVTDSTAARVILFATSHEAVGQHAGTIGDLVFAEDLAAVVSVTPKVALTDGAVYDVKLEYQDSLLNPASIVIHQLIRFAGTTTIQPDLLLPADNDKIPLIFKIKFTLFETAAPNSLKLLFTANDPSADPHSPHELELSPAMEIVGTHTIPIPQLSLVTTSSASAGNVDSLTPSGQDLIDSVVYSVTVKCVFASFFLFLSLFVFIFYGLTPPSPHSHPHSHSRSHSHAHSLQVSRSCRESSRPRLYQLHRV